MPIASIRVPSFMGGVTTMTQNQRLPFEVEEMLNCDIRPTQGTGDRAGTEHIAELDLEDAEDVMHTFWIHRSDTEKWVGFINPAATSPLDVIQIFSLTDGSRATVVALDSTGTNAPLDDADADVVALVGYLTAGTQTPRQRYRTVTVEDSTFLLNREVVTALEGAAITYRNGLDPTEVRNQNNAQNVAAWRDLAHPPSSVSPYPDRATLVAGGNIDSTSIWYTVDDDIGLPQGFWWAISTTQPPWYQRLPTEGALSFIDRSTMPIRLAYTGSEFVLQFPAWEPRKAGDSTTNPGPSFIGNALSDICFHQGRLWFVSGERVVSSRAGDIFNLWLNSTALQTDADPIDEGIQGRRQSNIIFAESFRESLILITEAARQVELRANGPITPLSVQLYDASHVNSANYAEPVVKGAQLYFLGEIDYSNIVWQYDYSPEQVSNIATDNSARSRGYIPAEVHWMAASESQDQLFLLTLAEPDTIYVNKGVVRRAEASESITAWYRWVLPGASEVISCQVYDEFLFLAVRRNGGVYIERLALGDPAQDIDGSPAQTLSFAVRQDRKSKVQGVYDPDTNTTSWTLNFVEPLINSVVLAPTWDTEHVKAGGTPVHGITVTVGESSTVVTAPGDYENNGAGVDAPAFVGISFESSITLSQLFVRDSQGTILHGNTHLMRAKLRHRQASGYTVEVTPEGRATVSKHFVAPQFGSSYIDGDIPDYGEFQFKIMTHAQRAHIKLINTSPFPATWVDMEVDCEYIPQSYSPVR